MLLTALVDRVGSVSVTERGQAGAVRVSGGLVLVVEDDDGSRLLVRRLLEADGHTVVESADGPGALLALSTSPVDVVVLDLGLPGIDGMQVLAEIRRASAVPVLVVTGRAEETQRVLGLDAGADDYVVKPYSLPELAARVRALLRRVADEAPTRLVRHGPVTLDLAVNCAEVDGQALPLTPKEYALLEFLVLHSPSTYSREALLHHVWGSMSEWQDDATVTEHVRRLRAKLARAGVQGYIRTVRGFGYLVEEQ